MSIVVVGSIAFDHVKTPFGEREHALGGAANYFSMSSSFFTHTKLVGVVGQDFPKAHLDYLQERQIDISAVQKTDGKTFYWQGHYGYDLNEPKTLKTELNVFADFKPDLPTHYRDAETVFLANIDPTLQLQVLNQVKSPRLTALDTMNFWISSKKNELLQAIERVNILFINESELRQLTQEHSIMKAARAIQALGPRSVVVKRGEYGAVLFDQGEAFFVPGYPLEDLFDPTGAGDTFAGGFLGWMDQKGQVDFETLKEAMTLGSVMASFVIEDFSFDRLKRLTRPEIERRCQILQSFSTASREIKLAHQ